MKKIFLVIGIIVLLVLIGFLVIGKWGEKSILSSGTEISKWVFVDGNTAEGINKDASKSIDHPQLTVFNSKLYSIWTEEYYNEKLPNTTVNQIRVAVYNGHDAKPIWSFVDGNSTYGINRDNTKNAGKAQLTVFDDKLYAVWKEDGETASQIRLAVYNGNDTKPAWTFVDGDATHGVNKDKTKNADAPQLTVFKEKLYAIWKEHSGTAGQVRVAVYNDNDTNPSWTFVDGNTANGINKDSTREIYAPQLTVFKEKLYAVWKEYNGTEDQIRVAVYNGNETNPLWTFVDGNTTNGINKDNTKIAFYPQLTVFNTRLYAIWEEFNGTTTQIRVAVYNSNDANPTWSFVDGNTTDGINKDKTKDADTAQLTVFNKKLYASWVERSSTEEYIRIAVYNGNDASPVWTFVDGNTAYGINKDKTKMTDSPQLTAFKNKLYATWSENNGTAWQVRVAVGQ